VSGALPLIVEPAAGGEVRNDASGHRFSLAGGGGPGAIETGIEQRAVWAPAVSVIDATYSPAVG
jgi:hypothetical protein